MTADTSKTPTPDAAMIERARAERLLLRLFHYRHRPGISEPSEWYEGDIRMLLAYGAAEAEAAAAAALEYQQWQPIPATVDRSKTPFDGVEVLVYAYSYQYVMRYAAWGCHLFHQPSQFRPPYEPTHWQPLTAPPKETTPAETES